MKPAATRWVILAGGLSPYTLELWERVASQPGQKVALFHIRRAPRTDFEHEKGQMIARRVRVTEIRGAAQAARVALRPTAMIPDVLVCYGHSPVYNLASSILAQLQRKARCVAYASDANGIAKLAEPPRAMTEIVLLARRAVIGRTFDVAFTLGLSNSIAHGLSGIGKLVPIPLLGVPEDVAPTEAAPSALERRIAELQPPVIAAVARLSPEKNLASLVRAWRSARGTGTHGSLVLVGEGPERSMLDSLAAGEPSIQFLGAVPYWQMGPLFRRFDALVLPSLVEPWGIVVTEALCHGIPVLASSQVGSATSLAAEAPGAVMIVDADERMLEFGLAAFLAQIEKHKEAARQAAPRIRGMYGMQSIADRLVQFGISVRDLRRAGDAPADGVTTC